MMQSCAKEQWGVDERPEAIAQSGTPSGAEGEGSDEGQTGEGSGNDGTGETGEDSTPAAKPEFIDNNDWSAYDENEYLIGFGAVDETAAATAQNSSAGDNSSEGSKATIDLSDRTVSWESGDEATVYVPATGASGTYAYDATRSQFRPKTTDDIVAIGDNLAYVYYPTSLFSSYSDGTATVTMPSAVTAGSIDDLGDKLPMSGIIPASQGVPYPTVTFRNLCSILRVQLTGCETITSVTLSNTGVALSGSNAGSVTWSGGTASAVPTLAMSGDSKSVTISCGAGLTLNESTPSEFYFLLPSSGTMDSMKVRVNFLQNDGSYDYTPYIEKTRSSSMTLSSYRSKLIKLAFRAGFFSGGKGTAAAPYQIATAADFQNLGTYCGSASTQAQYGYNSTAARNYFRSTVYYTQTADINLSGTSLGPIGSSTYPVYLSYDGGSHTLSNATMSNGGSLYVGLFGYCNGGTFQNIKLSSSSITGTFSGAAAVAGGIVAYLTGGGTATACQCISTSVTGYKAGGVVGYLNNGTISSCDAMGVTVTGNTSYAGGLVAGAISGGTISGCNVLGSTGKKSGGTQSVISSPTRSGGLVGNLGESGGSGTATVSQCYVSCVRVTASGDYAGGLAGYVYANGTINGNTASATVTNYYGDVSVSANNYAGGVAGYNAGTINGATNASSPYLYALAYSVTVNATTSWAGGIAGSNFGTLYQAYASTATVKASSAVGGLAGYCGGSSRISKSISRSCTIWAIDASSNYGNNAGGIVGNLASGTVDMSAIPADSGPSNDIKGAANVGGVCGNAAAGTSVTGSTTNAVCSGTTIVATGNNVGAVVGRCSTNISNCIVKGTNSVSGASAVGGIAGYVADGSGTITISGCSVQGTQTYVASSQHVAGIAASIDNAMTISDCTVSGTQNYTSAGGLGGIASFTKNDLTISSCTVGQITIGGSGTDGNMGGILGYMSADGYAIRVTGCSKSGSFNAGSRVTIGGIVGWARGTNTQIDQCTNTGTVNGNYNVGGIVGSFDCSTSSSFIFRCRNTANVTASGYRAGGIAGCCYGGIIKRCYSSSAATITAPYTVGGLVGYLGASNAIAVLINSSSRSSVTSTSYNGAAYNCSTGGLVGQLYSKDNTAYIANCVQWGNTNIQNTNAAACICIGGIVGYVNQGDGGSAKSLIQNCYVQLDSGNLMYKNGTTCPDNAKYGGIFGHLQVGEVYDCYYRTSQAGVANTGTTTTNHTKVATGVKNGTATFSPTLSNGTALSNKKLVDALNGGVKDSSGTRITYQGESMSDWTTYTSGANLFALPQVIYDLGTNFYNN